MGTQFNALPALPIRARTVSGCLNSALLGLERNRPAVVTSQLPGEPASALLCSCFATESLAQTAPLSRATNRHIKANRVPPCGFVQEPVPERPQTLAVKPSSAQGPSGTGFFLFSTTHPSSIGERGTFRAKHISRVPDRGRSLPLRALLAAGTPFFYHSRSGFAGNRAGSPVRSRARLYKMTEFWSRAVAEHALDRPGLVQRLLCRGLAANPRAHDAEARPLSI